MNGSMYVWVWVQEQDSVTPSYNTSHCCDNIKTPLINNLFLTSLWLYSSISFLISSNDQTVYQNE